MTHSKFAYIFVVLAIILSVVSCKKKQETEDIVVDKPVEEVQNSPIDMGNKQNSGTVKWISDNPYTYEIKTSADSSRVVTNHGKDYCDNNITLTVKRSDGTQFFQKKFTKDHFATLLPGDIRKSGVLTNMSFIGVDGNHMNFVVTVGSPDENNEESFLVKLVLDNNGNISSSVYQEEIGD